MSVLRHLSCTLKAPISHLDSLFLVFLFSLFHLFFSTPISVPFAPPQFNMVYESIRTDQGTRSIVLYWNPLNETDANGRHFYYLITYVPTFINSTYDLLNGQNDSNDLNSILTDHSSSDVHVRPLELKSHRTSSSTVDTSSFKSVEVNPEVEIKIDQITRSFYTIDLISSSTAYLFKIYSGNEMGKSLDFSKIIIQKEHLLPPRPVSVEAFYYGKNKYEVRWSHPIEVKSNFNISSYIISWCVSSKPVIARCTGPVKSIEIATNGTRETATTLEVTEDTNHQFAVSAKYNDGQYSPLSWSSCIVPIGLKKLEKLPKVYAKAINSTAISVTWKVTCDALTSVITKYELIYCKWSNSNSSCIGSKITISIENSTAREFIIKNLKPSTTYRFQLTAWTENTAGDESDLFFETTPSPPISIWFLVLMSIVAILCVVISLLKCLYTRYKFIFFVWKTQIELPSEIQVRTFDCDANSSSNVSSFRYSKKYAKNCAEAGGDHLSARTLSTTIGNMSSDTFNTSLSGNLLVNLNGSGGPTFDRFGSKAIRNLASGMEESTLSTCSNIATIGGNVDGKEDENHRIYHYLNTNDGHDSSLALTSDSHSEIFSSSHIPLLYSSPFGGPSRDNRIYSSINPKSSERAVPGPEDIPLIIRNSYDTQESLETANSKVFFDTQPSISSNISSATSSHPRTLVKQDSFDLESGYATTPCLSKESSIESGKSKSNIAATSLTKKGYVPFIPQYLDSTAS